MGVLLSFRFLRYPQSTILEFYYHTKNGNIPGNLAENLAVHIQLIIYQIHMKYKEFFEWFKVKAVLPVWQLNCQTIKNCNINCKIVICFKIISGFSFTSLLSPHLQQDLKNGDFQKRGYRGEHSFIKNSLNNLPFQRFYKHVVIHWFNV